MAAKVNKSALIRELLKSESSPSKVAALMKERHGIDVKATYVAVIKSKAVKTAKPVGGKKPKAKRAKKTQVVKPEIASASVGSDSVTMGQIRDMAAFVKSVGGTAKASRIVDQLESSGGLDVARLVIGVCS